MDSENNTCKNTNKEDCVLVDDEDKTLDESNLNTTIGNETSKLAAKTPVSQTKKANKNGDLNNSITNSCDKLTKEQRNQMKLENAKKRQEEKEKKEREKKEKEELRAKQEEERKRKKEEEEKQRLKRLEEKEKQEEERKRKREEEEKLRLKRLEEKEKEKQERIEKERKRQEQINSRNEEKRKREEEKKRAEEEKKRLEEEKLREEEEKRRKADKVKSHFASYFIKKDTPTNQTDREELKSLRFMPFQLKANMHLAPLCRNVEFANMNQEQREEFIANIDSFVLNDSNQTYETNYLKLLRENGKIIRRNYKSTRRGRFNKLTKSEIKTDETSNDEIKLIENIVPSNNMTRYKVKYLHFDPKQYRRPPYYGTWNKKSNMIRGRNPFGKDEKIIDYEIDSDDEWEDEADGESIADSDKGDMEEDTVNGDDEDDDGFFVPHGHLSDDELDEEERNLDEETKKAKEEAKKEQYETERNKKSKYLVPKCFFLNEYWNVPDKLDLDSVRSELKNLNKYQMVPLMTPLPFIINNEVPNQDKKSDETTGKNSKNSDYVSSPNPTPKSKSSKQAKQNLNNSSTQSPSNATANANNKGSIIKFISKLSNKTGKIEAVGTNSATPNPSSETTTTQNVTNTAETIISKTTDNINTKNTPTAKLKKGNSSVVLKQGSPSTPLNTKNPTNTSTTAEKRTCNENSESAVKRLKLDDGQSTEPQKSATKVAASPTILTLFKNSSCRKNLRLSSCEIDMREEDTIVKQNEDDKINLLTPKKGSIKANSIDENNIKSVKTDVLMDTSESVDKNENTNNKENSAIITID